MHKKIITMSQKAETLMLTVKDQMIKFFFSVSKELIYIDIIAYANDFAETHIQKFPTQCKVMPAESQTGHFSHPKNNFIDKYSFCDIFEFSFFIKSLKHIMLSVWNLQFHCI